MISEYDQLLMLVEKYEQFKEEAVRMGKPIIVATQGLKKNVEIFCVAAASNVGRSMFFDSDLWLNKEEKV